VTTPTPDKVARAKAAARQNIALGQAVPADHARILLEALGGATPCNECHQADAELCRTCAVDVKF
jgi:hypothetical protein